MALNEMANVTLTFGTECVQFHLTKRKMDIYGRSGSDCKWLVVQPKVSGNPSAMIVIWYENKTFYARMQNEFNIKVNNEIGPVDDHGNTHLRDGDEIQVTKDDTIYLQFYIFVGQEVYTTTHKQERDRGSRNLQQSMTIGNIHENADHGQPSIGEWQERTTVQKKGNLVNKHLYAEPQNIGGLWSNSNKSQPPNVKELVNSYNKKEPRHTREITGRISSSVYRRGQRRGNTGSWYSHESKEHQGRTHGRRCDSATVSKHRNENPGIWHESIESLFNKGIQIKGIPNIGMTCYASGIIQILAQTKQFLRNASSFDEKCMPLAYSLGRVLREINEPGNQTLIVNRGNIEKILGIIAEDSSFAGYRQNDCLEFLMFLFERLKTEGERITLIFEMKLQNVIQSLPCKHVDFCDIQLSFHLLVPLNGENPTELSVKSGLKKMLNCIESYSGQEVLPCSKCDKDKDSETRTSLKVLIMSKAPEILILQIGRVETSEHCRLLQKQDVFVQYDRELTIGEEHWDENGKREIRECVYHLYGVVSHLGLVSCGHYSCYVKKQYTSEWFHCNDEVVTLTNEKMVLSSSDAILLFYERIAH